MSVDEIIEMIARKIDEGEYHQDPTAFVEARLLLKNELPHAIEAEKKEQP